MIQSKISKEVKESSFPKLMIHKSRDYIVLFRAERIGVVLLDDGNIGIYDDNWKMSEFTDYHGEITLSNK
jgi:hypothetical protein